MRPIVGVSVETIALGAALALRPAVPPGVAFAAYFIICAFLATYLVHCPAHYVTGKVLGIGFSKISIGRTTLGTALPPRFSRFSGLLSVPTLKVDRSTIGSVSKERAAAMYASGTVGSIVSAFAVAAWATSGGLSAASALTWVFAFGYLAFDLIFSPKSGDLKRARAATRSLPREPFRA